MGRTGLGMWSRVLKWLKTNNEEVADIILDLAIGVIGIVILAFLFQKYIDILFEFAMIVGERM